MKKVKEFINGKKLLFSSKETKQKLLTLVSKMLERNLSLKTISSILEIPEKDLETLIENFIEKEDL